MRWTSGDGVAGQQVLAVAQADHERAAEPGADETWPGRRGTDDAQAVGPFQPGKGPLQGGEQVVAVAQLAGNQVRAITSVSVWLTKWKPSASSSRRRATWFSITPLWTTATEALRPPTCGWALRSVAAPWVAQRVCPMPQQPGSNSQREVLLGASPDPAGALVNDQAVAVQSGDAGTVISAVLQAVQARQQDRAGLDSPRCIQLYHTLSDSYCVRGNNITIRSEFTTSSGCLSEARDPAIHQAFLTLGCVMICLSLLC